MNQDTEKITKIQEKLLAWGSENIRSFPWRFNDNKYEVLVSEFMLHRTAVRQVEPIYIEFINRYPSLSVFFDADRDEIRSLLKSLGLNWRIEGMIVALETLYKDYKEVPSSEDKLISVKGIGPYIASATLCFATGKKKTLVDTNTVRLIGRIFGLDLRGEARRRRDVINKIESSVDEENPREFYYSVIDIAHEICKPTNPKCGNCPLLDVPCDFGSEILSGE